MKNKQLMTISTKTVASIIVKDEPLYMRRVFEKWGLNEDAV